MFYWPGMTDYIHEKVESCAVCNSLAPHQQKQPFLSHPVPALPWSTVATDIFEWLGKQYLVLFYSYSSYFDIDLLSGPTSHRVVLKLAHQFSDHGAPCQLPSDNGSQFTSQHFKDFAARWGFRHIISSPEYPQSNGLAERAVRCAKQLMERSHRGKSDVYMDLRNISLNPILGSPAQRLLSRQTRATLPVANQELVPQVVPPSEVQSRLQQNRHIQKGWYDKTSRPLPPLAEGQVVRLQTDKGHDRNGVISGTAP